jgi:hypothetical protein
VSLWRAWTDASFRRGSCGIAAILADPDGEEEIVWATTTASSSVQAEARAIAFAAQALAERGALAAVIHSDCQAALGEVSLPAAYRLQYARDGRIARADRIAARVRRGQAPQQGRHRPMPTGLAILLADGAPRPFSAVVRALPYRHRRPRERVRLTLDLLLDNLEHLAWQDGGLVLRRLAAPHALTDDDLVGELLTAAGPVGERRARRLAAAAFT